jgi:hypothetical protein
VRKIVTAAGNIRLDADRTDDGHADRVLGGGAGERGERPEQDAAAGAADVLGLISLKTADLLFGQEPKLAVDDEVLQAKVEALAKRTLLYPLLYGCAVDASYEAECFLEACVHQGKVYLKQLPADEMFPQGELQPDLQYTAYVRYSLRDVGTKEAPILLLLETHYLAGSIERRLWQLDRDGRKQNEIGLEAWVKPVGGPVPPGVQVPQARQATGLDRCTVTWIPNMLARGRAVSDYDGAIDLQDALNAKNSQVARVLLKHSDPKMAFPAAAFDEKGNIRSDYDAFPFREPGEIPQYITWEAQLDAAMKDRAFVLNNLLVTTETSPVLLGLKEGAAPDAYKKVRLESFNSLTKAQRKAAFWKAGIARAVEVAVDLDNTIPGTRYDRYPIGVEPRDGIPVDENEQAQTIALLRPSGAMSVERAVELQIPDPAAQEKELARLAEERAAATPSILLGEPGQAEGSGVRGQGLEQSQTQPPAEGVAA